MVVFALWLFTSAYATEVSVFPDGMTCAMAAVQMAESFDKPPKPFLYRLACVPRMMLVPTMRPAPVAPTGPSA